MEREGTIGQRDVKIKDLEKELQRLRDISSSTGEQASELQKQLADTRMKLEAALDEIKRLEQ